MQSFDIVILDPPSFVKSKKNIDTAMRGYIDLNCNVIKNMKKSSFLFTFSCSHHIDDKLFKEIITRSSAEAKKKIKVIESLNCSPDHPILPFMSETKYLQGFLLQIL
jgi:23S rRNA (cytosine1962-C5)-methyltransferase